MPSTVDFHRVRDLDPAADRRRALTPEDRETIRELVSQGAGINATARAYGVDKRTIQFIAFPDRLERNKALRAARGGSVIYYRREKHTKAMARHRAHKADLLKRLLPVLVLFFWIATPRAEAITPAEIEQLIPALITVESGGLDYVTGDGGLAAGCLQIHPIMVKDANRIAGTSYTLADRFDRRKSIEIARIYFRHYGRGWTIERAARAWNAGPTSTAGTDGYWRKVKKELDRNKK